MIVLTSLPPAGYSTLLQLQPLDRLDALPVVKTTATDWVQHAATMLPK